MIKILRLLIALLFLAAARKILRNDSIVKIVRAGLGVSLIVSMIQNQPEKHSLTHNDLVNLKQLGVSEKILPEMVARIRGRPGHYQQRLETLRLLTAIFLQASISASTKSQASWTKCFRRSSIGRPAAS